MRALHQSSLWKLPCVNGDLTHTDTQAQELAMPLEFSLWQSAFFLHVIPWTIVLSRTPSRCLLAANERHNVPEFPGASSDLGFSSAGKNWPNFCVQVQLFSAI